MTVEDFSILGAQVVEEVAGADAGGFDASFLVNAASELAQRGVSTYEKQQASEKSAADTKARADRAVLADIAWADAETSLEIATKSKDPARIAAAQVLAQSTAQDAASAGAGLPPAAVDKRVAAARETAKKAAQDSLASPSDASKGARMRAWQKVAAAAAYSAPAGGGALVPHEHGQSSFFTKVYAGVPVWGWGVGGLGVVAGLYLILRKK